MKAKVALLSAPHSLEDRELEEKVVEAVNLIGGLPRELEKASRILIKPNLGGNDWRRHKGRLVALTEPSITRAVLRMIRDVNPDAEILLADGGLPRRGQTSWEALKHLFDETGHTKVVEEFNARIVDANEPPYVEKTVPGGGLIMQRYLFNKEIVAAEATVSVQKLKVHLAAGVSLSIKNLFGLPPIPPYRFGWGARNYLHYLIRLPRCLVDLAAIFKPSLTIIDGLIGEELQEWEGPPVESNLLIAGNNAVATDAAGSAVMGFNPEAEFPEEPNLFDINHIRLAAERGLGPVELSQIELLGDDLERLKVKFRKRLLRDLTPEFHARARERLAVDALLYRESLPKLLPQYEGQRVAFMNGQVQWAARTDEEVREKMRMQFTFRESMKKEYQEPFLKVVEPPEKDPEVYEAYKETVKH
ncbi:MAG: DUF362 domain-containing protein [Candidatus Bathyarchaeia archaeon]